MRHQRTLIAASAMALAIVSAACNSDGQSEPNASPRIYRGNAVPVGNGTAQAYILTDGDVPIEIGVALSKRALDGLPVGGGTGGHEHGVTFFEHLLALPENNPTPFRFIELDWNPGGHEPPGIYDRPHFDFHFYTTDLSTRNSIVPENPDFTAKGTRRPSLEYVPAGYIAPEPLVVPKMGLHWINPQSPEFNGKPFTTTFIYGTWDGRVIFAEPMITKAFIESTRDTTIAVPVASRYEVAGYYPSSYRVRFDEASQEYRIALSGFAKRPGGAQ
jgi:hypothetical protein